MKMAQTNIQFYYSDLVAAFHVQFVNVRERQGVEDVHRLRIAIKKLRAVYTLITAINKSTFSRKAQFKVYAALFQQAGRVRDIQVNIKLTTKYDASYILPYKAYLLRLEESSIKGLLSEMDAFDFAEFDRLNTELLEYMQELTDKKVIKASAAFVLKRLKKIKKLKWGSVGVGKLHRLRIYLRQTLEVLGVMHALNPALRLVELQKSLKSLYSRIGVWHDDFILVRSLKTFIKEEADIMHLQRLIIFTKQRQRWNARRGVKLGRRLDSSVTSKTYKPLKVLV